MSPSNEAAAIPADLITTGEAIAALLAADPDLIAWKSAECPRSGGDITRVDTEPMTVPGNELHMAAEASYARIIKAALTAVRDGSLKATVYVHELQEPRNVLETDFWDDDFCGTTSLSDGRVLRHSLWARRPLCFDRVAWAAWSARLQGVEIPSADSSATAGVRELPDGELVARLARMVLNGEYKSANAAAFAIPLEEIPNRGGSENSIRRRVAEKVRLAMPTLRARGIVSGS